LIVEQVNNAEHQYDDWKNADEQEKNIDKGKA